MSDGFGMSWVSDELVIRRTTGPELTEDYHMEQEVLQEFSATGEEWLDLVADILIMLEGKPSDDGQNYVTGPPGIDAGLIGELVAHKIRDRRALRNS